MSKLNVAIAEDNREMMQYIDEGLGKEEFQIIGKATDGKSLFRMVKEKHPDVVVLDPPRKGCDEEGLLAVTEMAPARIVMVSCNPSTAARDCKFLCGHGYTLKEYTPVDLFPRTGHCECVIKLVRE